MLSKRDRLHQVHRWLSAEFPCKPVTRLRVLTVHRPRNDDGDECLGIWCPRSNVIYIDGRMGRSEAVTTLIHEYTHARTQHMSNDDNNRPDHDDDFYLELGALERRFFEEGGMEDSEDA